MPLHHRSLARRSIVSLLGTACLLVASPAAAQEDERDVDRNDQVVLNGRLVVAEGETVDTAVMFNGPTTIDGTVQDTLVVFNGRTDISGIVRGDVVVFNGAVTVRSGAEIDGDLVTRSTPQIEQGATVRGDQQSVATRFDLENIGFASRYAWWLGYSISTLVLGLLLLLLLPTLDAGLAAAWRGSAGLSIGVGAALFFLVPIVAVVLLATIVAIPLGLFVLLALALLYTAGYVVGAHVLGRQLIRPPASRYVAFLVGWGIARVVALIPFLGGFVWLVAAIVGLGVLAVAARRSQPAIVTGTGTVPPPPVPS
jgi:hypothetical protein